MLNRKEVEERANPLVNSEEIPYDHQAYGFNEIQVPFSATFTDK